MLELKRSTTLFVLRFNVLTFQRLTMQYFLARYQWKAFQYAGMLELKRSTTLFVLTFNVLTFQRLTLKDAVGSNGKNKILFYYENFET
jgi:hypothetical protein